MNKALQKYTAWLILVFYIPVVLLLGFDHKHEPAVRPPSGKHLVINKLDTHSLSQNPFDGFCPACHFSQGHVFPQSIIITLPFNVHKFLVPVRNHLIEFRLNYSPGKRAPPSIA